MKVYMGAILYHHGNVVYLALSSGMALKRLLNLVSNSHTKTGDSYRAIFIEL